MIRDDLIYILFYVFAYITGQNLELFDTNKDFDILYITFEIFVFLLIQSNRYYRYLELCFTCMVHFR